MTVALSRRALSGAILGLGLAGVLAPASQAAPATTDPAKAAEARRTGDVRPWPVKVVVVTTSENGADTGDKPGELQLWAEREDLTERLDFPGGVHPLLTNKDHSVVAMVTGMGLVNSGASVMALAFDRRFDLKKAYWLVAGVGGVDPKVGAIGDAAWADYVVNDLAKSMDMREAPAGWPYGIYPMRSSKAGEMPSQKMEYGPFDRYAQVFPLNIGLTRWAYELTKSVPLDYAPELAAQAKVWTGFPNAQQPPRVRIGSSFASNHFWHGEAGTQWARDWVRMFTDGKATFTMSDMEDSSIAEAMARLERMGLVNAGRLMVLRAASNYTLAHPGQTTFESAMSPHPGDGLPAYEAAYRVGSKVVHELASGWTRYADQTPSAP